MFRRGKVRKKCTTLEHCARATTAATPLPATSLAQHRGGGAKERSGRLLEVELACEGRGCGLGATVRASERSGSGEGSGCEGEMGSRPLAARGERNEGRGIGPGVLGLG